MKVKSKELKKEIKAIKKLYSCSTKSAQQIIIDGYVESKKPVSDKESIETVEAEKDAEHQ